MPAKVRPFSAALVGTMLGTSFSPALLDQAGSWLITILGLVAFLIAATAICFAYYRHVVGLDRNTALFSAMPGGIVEMVLLGEEKGADIQTIAIIHAARIFLVVSLLPALLYLIAPDISVASIGAANAETSFDWTVIVWLAVTTVGGVLVGQLLRLPIAFLLGPMLVGGIIHVAGWSNYQLPSMLLAIAQVVLGASVGCRFAGIGWRRLLGFLGHSLGATALLVSVTLLFAFIMSMLIGLPLMAGILAYAPGGLAEMSLVALSLNVDVAFVVLHHILRVLFVLLSAPIIIKWFERAAQKTRE